MAKKSVNKVASSNTFANLTAELDKLCQQREEWEGNAYKRSNDQLYAILARCLDIYILLKDDVDQRKDFRKKLDKLKADGKIIFNEGTNLPTRIVRYVFRNSGKRSFAYAKTIIAAAEAKIDSVGLAAWITDQRGVEQVRRQQKGVMPSVRDQNLRAIAAAKLANTSALVPSLRGVDELQPNPDGETEFSVALLRKEADGTFSIVFGSHNTALVNKFLTVAGKKLEGKDLQAQQTDVVRSQNAARNAALSQAA